MSDFSVKLNFEDIGASKLVDLTKQTAQNLDKAHKTLENMASQSAKDLIKNAKTVNDTYEDIIKSQREIAKATGIETGLVKYAGELEKISKKHVEIKDIIEEVKDHEEALIKARTKAEKESIEEVLSLRRGVLQTSITEMNKMNDHLKKSMEKTSKDVQKTFISDQEKLGKMLKKELPESFGKGIGEGINKALNKGDIQSILSGSFDFLGKAGNFGVSKVQNIRQRRQMEGDLKGKAPGKGANLLGTLGRTMGSMLTVIGPMLAAAGGLAMIVKLIFDAEAQAKDLNKTLTSSVPLMRLGGGNLEVSVDRMKELREAATDWRTNMKLGIDAKQHYEVITALEEHNFGINKVAEGYNSIGEASTDMVTKARQASLNLGVDMKTIAEFMAKMHDLGSSSLPQIHEDLNLIVTMAEKSGVSMKKFFTTVSQFTDQMALYNYKIEDSVYLLGAMHKIMDSGSAEKFVKSMTTGFKEMSAVDRLKEMMLATGGDQSKVIGMVRQHTLRSVEDLDPSSSGIIRDVFKRSGINVGDTVEDLHKAMEKMTVQQMGDAYNRIMVTQGEGAATTFSTTATAVRQIGRGDALSAAEAAGNLNSFAQLDNKLDKLMGQVGRDSSDIMGARSTVTSAIGINEEELKMLQRVVLAHGNNLSEIQRIAKVGDEEGLSKLADSMGIKLALQNGEVVNESGRAIRTMGDLIQSLQSSEKEELLKGTTPEDFAERQVKETQAVGDILKYMIADLLNWIGGGVENIVHVVRSIPYFGGEYTDAQKKEYERRQELTKARESLSAIRRQRDLAIEKNNMSQVGILNKELAQAQEKVDEAERSLNYIRGVNLSPGGAAKSLNKVHDDHTLNTMKAYMSFDSDFFSKGDSELLANREQSIFMPNELAEVQREMLNSLEDGNASRDLIEAKTQDILTREGINLNKDAKTKLVDAIIEASVKSKVANDLMKTNKFTYDQANQAAIIKARGLTPNPDAFSPEQLKLIDEVKVPSTGDARILTSGVAALNFKAGDMVVDRDSLARTVRGRAGEFVPDLLNEAFGGRSRGGQGVVMNNVFNINGGNPAEIETTILRAFEMLQRKQYGEN